MINQYEVSDHLNNLIPEMKEMLVKKAALCNGFDAYKAMQCLADFTSKSAHDHNLKMLRRCFNAAQKLYTKGNAIVKNAVENIFVYSFPVLFSGCGTRQEQYNIQSAIPAHLYKIYMKQVSD